MNFLAKLAKVLLHNFSSRKLWMTLIALSLLYGIYWRAVAMIYSFDDAAQLNAFLSLTTQMLWGVITIVLGYVGIQTAQNFSSNASNAIQSLVNNAASSVKENKRTENVNISITEEIKAASEKFAGDPSYRPIENPPA